MTKADLVAAIQKKADLPTKVMAEQALNAFISVLESSLAAGNDVTLTGFGSFKVTKRAARTGRNPQTGKEIKIPARKVVRFSAGKGLKDALN